MIPAIIVGFLMLSTYAIIALIQKKFGNKSTDKELVDENDKENEAEILNNLINKIENENKENK